MSPQLSDNSDRSSISNLNKVAVFATIGAVFYPLKCVKQEQLCMNGFELLKRAGLYVYK